METGGQLGPRDAEFVGEEHDHPEAPEGMNGWYRTTLRRKDEEPLGLHVQTICQGLLIQNVQKGAVTKHNLVGSDQEFIYKMDIITNVNGIDAHDPEGMIKELETWKSQSVTQTGSLADRKARTLIMDLAHPELVEVTVTCENDHGLTLDGDDSGKYVEILKISEGGAKEYNEKCDKPPKRLHKRDLIREVNGVAGDSKAMLQQFKDVKTYELKILRAGKPTKEASQPKKQAIVEE